MCKILNISRSLIYYKKVEKTCDSKLDNEIISIFKKSRNNYGSRKIKVELSKIGYIASRRKIRRIMSKYSLVSKYTLKQYKVHKTKCNEEKINNLLERDFKNKEKLDVIVSDLTYVNVNGKWNYICILLDLYNREIIGYSAGANKDKYIVYKAFANVKYPLDNINILHTDRGNEFKNSMIDNLLKTFNISRSLSKKGCPYDNAVAEATFKIIKTEFVFNRIFKSFEELETSLFDYVNWYNKFRVHSSLGYLNPIEYKAFLSEKKLS